MALTAYEIIKRSSPSLAKHFKETEDTLSKVANEINKVKPDSGICDFFNDSIVRIDNGYDYIIIPEHIDGKPTGKCIVIDTASPYGYRAGSSSFKCFKDMPTDGKIQLLYSDDYKKMSSPFFLVKYNDVDIYMMNVLKSVIANAESNYNEEIIVEANENGIITVNNSQVNAGAILKYEYNGIYHYIELRDHHSESGQGQYAKNYTLDDSNYLHITSTTAEYSQLKCEIVTISNISNFNIINLGIVELGENYSYNVSNDQLLNKINVVRFGIELEDNVYYYFIQLTEITSTNAHIVTHVYGKHNDNDYQINADKSTTNNGYDFYVTTVSE